MGCATALFFGHPPGAPGRVQRSTIIFEKSISKIFIPNFMFVLKNKRNGVFIMSPGSYSRWLDLGLLGGQNFYFFSKHGRVAYQIEGVGEQNGTQVKCSPYVQTCVNRSIIIQFLRERGVLAMAPHRLRDYKYSLSFSLDVSKFGDCWLIAHLASLLHQ